MCVTPRLNAEKKDVFNNLVSEVKGRPNSDQNLDRWTLKVLCDAIMCVNGTYHTVPLVLVLGII